MQTHKCDRGVDTPGGCGQVGRVTVAAGGAVCRDEDSFLSFRLCVVRGTNGFRAPRQIAASAVIENGCADSAARRDVKRIFGNGGDWVVA